MLPRSYPLSLFSSALILWNSNFTSSHSDALVGNMQKHCLLPEMATAGAIAHFGAAAVLIPGDCKRRKNEV